ncbi:hypothetical protein Ahy_B06g085340 [Arachis hypogaea]|uniref:Aminotransferase-like plant mobile domain-containing protein n=1 Tax=Arachis hypogaea TaxID=3818 RepID=A0A444YU72_ARAHY|nr:hypothetical protein Ahy_B06g085340 [Arachis hypogaea]
MKFVHLVDLKTHDLRCSTRSIARVFTELSEEKKTIVEEMGFGALRRIPELNVSHKLLRELILCFDLYHRFLDTHYGKIYITSAKIGDALGLNSGGDHFPKKVAYNKLNEGGELAEIQDDFIVFVQKCFLLLTTISIISSVHKPPALHVEIVRQWNWASHALSFLIKGIKAQRAGHKLFVDGCVFVLMLIYFHETKFPHLEADDARKPPWVAY